MKRVEAVLAAIQLVNEAPGLPERYRHLGRLWAIRTARTTGVNSWFVRAAVAFAKLKLHFDQRQNAQRLKRMLRHLDRARGAPH